MRPMLVIAGSIALLAVAGLLTWTRLGSAQAPPHPSVAAAPGEIMTITAAEGVEVRSGPGLNLYATSKLRYGDKVTIAKSDKNMPGWLAIEPPPGSRSWISAVFVKQTGPNAGVVATDENAPAAIKPASSLSDQEPNVESAKVARGTQVVILGAEHAGWLPIQPPKVDVRYIPESAVATVNAVQNVTAPASSGFVAPPGGDQSALSEADATLRKAAALYQQAAQSSDPNQKAQAQSRLQSLQQVQLTQVATLQPGYPTSSAGAAPKVVIGAATVQAQPTAGSNSLYSASSQTSQAAWGKWGTLRKTSLQKDGQPMYRLEDERGTPISYAVAAPGLTLEPHIGRFVCLYGATAYRSDDNALRTTYTIVTTLAYPPDHQ
jgi:uncharacterized protein YgiM (DUF1202 family)